MLVEKTVSQFIRELGSDSPAPGGGSTAALAGALAAALTSMVCRLTANSAKYAAVHGTARAILDKSERLAQKLTAYIDEDTQAFNAVMAAYKLPKATEEEKQLRAEAIQKATVGATMLPLKVAEHCLEVLDLAGQILAIGNANAASDAAVSGLMAHAGLKGALYNVKINLGGIKDAGFVRDATDRMAALGEQADRLQQELELAAQKII